MTIVHPLSWSHPSLLRPGAREHEDSTNLLSPRILFIQYLSYILLFLREITFWRGCPGYSTLTGLIPNYFRIYYLYHSHTIDLNDSHKSQTQIFKSTFTRTYKSFSGRKFLLFFYPDTILDQKKKMEKSDCIKREIREMAIFMNLL